MVTLYPVIVPIQEDYLQDLTSQAKVAVLKKTARDALAISAKVSQLNLGQLLKDERGAPLPSLGVYWSISHKTHCATGVVSIERIGIDVEEIRPRPGSQLFQYLATPDEWQLSHESGWELFYRYWTAKEAAVKTTGAGLKDLKACQVKSIPDENHLILEYQDHLWIIEHYWYNNHIISLVTNGKPVVWKVGLD